MAIRYSKPSDLKTSTMKSEPGLALSCASTLAAGVEFAATPCWAIAMGGFATSAAAPVAAPFRKPRRLTGFFLDLDTMRPRFADCTWKARVRSIVIEGRACPAATKPVGDVGARPSPNLGNATSLNFPHLSGVHAARRCRR